MNDDKTYTGVVNELERAVEALRRLRVHAADQGHFDCLILKATEQIAELRKRGNARFNARKQAIGVVAVGWLLAVLAFSFE